MLTTISRLLILTLTIIASQAWSATLSVTNGSGSGNYAEGASVHIWANPYDNPVPTRTNEEPDGPNAPHRIFDQWIGDTAFVEDPFAAHARVLMPATAISLTARFKDGPRWSAPRVITEFPAEYHSVIFMVHGSIGSAINQFTGTENKSFANEALARGFGLVAIDSLDRVVKMWNTATTFADNPDLQRVKAVRDDLIARGIMHAQDPIYVKGVSNGGRFASLFNQNTAEELGFLTKAAAIYISPGDFNVMVTSLTPTIFSLAANDTIVQSSNVVRSFNALLANDVPAQYLVNPPSPVYPQNFWSIEGLDENDSKAIYNALADAGLLDSDDFLIDAPQDTGWQEFIPEAYASGLKAIENQLLVAYAEHQFMGEFNSRVLDFFDNPVTVIDETPIVSDFDPPSGSALTRLTIFGDDFIGVSEVAFNGVPGTNLMIVSKNELRVIAPKGITTGPITVTNPAGTGTSAEDFLVDGPVILTMEPASGPPGALVALDGTGFMDVTSVTFNGVTAEFQVNSAIKVWARVPLGATTGPVSATTLSGTATSANDFVVLLPPAITGFTPTSGPADTVVTISGENLSTTQQVKFGGIWTTEFTVDSDTQVRATVPAGATNGKLRVKTLAGIAVSESRFIVP